MDSLLPRPPIVVVMGHIDHGKSKLLDFIRKTNVVAGETGGITQHIGAYEVAIGGHRLTFIDTPGHEAFAAMRLRGARVADIALLVVAADEGPKPQTLEAAKAIETAGIPFVVVLNKTDKPNANPEKVKGALAEENILVESYGGKVPCLSVSAVTGEGINELLETVVLLAEIAELKADPSVPGTGVVIEAKRDPQKGLGATLIIQNGTVRRGDYVVAGQTYAPVRLLEDQRGKTLEEASFSSPVRVVGFTELPSVGESFVTVESKREAETLTLGVKDAQEVVDLARGRMKTEEGAEPTVRIPLILKADAAGSLEALEYELRKVAIPGATISFARTGIGAITEADAKAALTEKEPVIIGFNVEPDTPGGRLIAQHKLKIVTAGIIYELREVVEKLAAERAGQVEREVISATAKIIRVFSETKKNQIVGGTVLTGTLKRGPAAVKRRGEELGRVKIVGLQHNKIETETVPEGQDFGLMVEGKISLAPQDELVVVEKVTG